ncbi:family 43 glycosylhydrolase [Novipirellula artificiosorum]|uniref:Intracellular endo-alpha-(1->5)-L-arabinanase n=1 Tax=Novipirellula artificiosorum TaxID=2528016 RepID=A0A5C6DMN9_9BACT|nr:family 43 glycosylhydrolase [Novipirellula artificiosorum]TWU37127.1 Intracellular endo-alpha-(1->5)-L-arabinanase [Novipirellula artificiosorum]
MRSAYLFLLLVLSVQSVSAEQHYLFSYFKGNGEDGLHLAHSTDGLRWTALKQDHSFLTPTVGEDRLMRDPSITQGPEGTFHMVWTSGWQDQGIGVAHSKDLVVWSEQERIGVMDHEPKCRNCWAPEIFYDDAKQQYLILWASTIEGEFPETAGSCENELNHRIYYVTTKDFLTYSETRLFFNPGFAVIDSFLVKDGDRYLLVSKDETRFPEPTKNLFVASADQAEGPYQVLAEPFSPEWVEGPSVLKVKDQWLVWFDEYTRKRYNAMQTTDFETWGMVEKPMEFPARMRHGTAFAVTEEIAKPLLEIVPTANSDDGILAGGADPAIVELQPHESKQGYMVAATGRGISLSYSPDLKKWKRVGRVFEVSVPAWAKQEVPKSNGLWAPDLSFHQGLYHLYYSVSSFGSQRSVIGLAVNKSLDIDHPDYNWIDRGKVIESWPGKGDFNAIDPALVVDAEGQWYLLFGSFWGGIKAIRIDPTTGKPVEDAEILSIASRPNHPTHAIEGAYVIHHDDYYYLFVSWDRCCDGADSDYKVAVGRSQMVTGPYVDADGKPMLDGGGTIVLQGDDRYRGPGHNSVLTTDAGQWIAHHTYDMQNLRAQRILQLRPLSWNEEGWPVVGEPLDRE